MDFKDTLNILKTDFEMKANLANKEPNFQRFWIDHKIYQKTLEKNKNGKKWTLHDGPPYANGNIHVGHALNKIIKDIIVRYKNMQGYYSEYIPGWDTHGLPIEHALLVSGKNVDANISVVQKRKNCYEFATKFIDLQITQFSRLGLLTDFQKIYRTYDNDYEVSQLELFLLAIKQGLIYRDLKPVYWSWSSQSALADAEVEYKDLKSHSIYVCFDVVDGKNVLNKDDKLICWTTTPWTIPSNLAIAVNPRFTYVRVLANGKHYIISQGSLAKISEKLQWKEYKVLSELSGSQLEHITYQHPLYKRVSPIILAPYVSNEDGTGLVHNAPGFGEDDYLACKKYNIHPFSPIDNHGKFTKEVADDSIIGMFYEKANAIILNNLLSKNALLFQEEIVHSAAHDWRTKKPVIYRSTEQWFIDIKKIQGDLLSALGHVSFKTEQNRRHLEDMIKRRTEWCISRQRVWGVPIPMIFDENNKPIYDFELIKNIINIIKKETTNVWYEKPVEYFLTSKYLNNDSHKEFHKEVDIMDVWFDSGTSFLLLEKHKLEYPANLYFEGNDQYRGWFNSSLINSVIYNKKPPYATLLSHGMVLDEKGNKMSKSLGNVIDPLMVCNKYGADILRLWAANTNFKDDVRISDNILSQTAEIYRRIRNSLFKFSLANIIDFDWTKDKNTTFDEVDNFVLSQLQNNINKINQDYENYDIDGVIKTINAHVIELSSWYFDLIKDALYCEKKNDARRRKIQTVLYIILYSYLILLTPIIPHTCEEVYSFFNIHNKLESINLEKWITSISVDFEKVLNDKWNYFFKIKEVVYSQLESIRNQKIINKNNQARVELKFDNQYNFTEKELAKYLNVAQVIFIDTKSTQVSVACDDAKLIKCQRCWNYYEVMSEKDQQICPRCWEATH